MPQVAAARTGRGSSSRPPAAGRSPRAREAPPRGSARSRCGRRPGSRSRSRSRRRSRSSPPGRCSSWRTTPAASCASTRRAAESPSSSHRWTTPTRSCAPHRAPSTCRSETRFAASRRTGRSRPSRRLRTPSGRSQPHRTAMSTSRRRRSSSGSPAAPGPRRSSPTRSSPRRTASRSPATARCSSPTPTTIASFGSTRRPAPSATSRTSATPGGIDIAADGTVYVIAARDLRLVRLSPAGAPLGPLGRAFNDPYDVELASDGAAYLLDTGATGFVRRIAPDGTVTTVSHS